MIPNSNQFDGKEKLKIPLWKISKSNSQGIEPKLRYPQKKHDSLNYFQFFETKKRRYKKVMSISNPRIQPKYVRGFVNPILC